MLIRPRKVRRSSKFGSRIKAGSVRRQEYAASLYSSAVIQVILALTLIIAGVRAFQAIDTHYPNLNPAVKLVMPVLFTLGGVFALFRARRNFLDARDSHASRFASEDRRDADRS